MSGIAADLAQWALLVSLWIVMTAGIAVDEVLRRRARERGEDTSTVAFRELSRDRFRRTLRGWAAIQLVLALVLVVSDALRGDSGPSVEVMLLAAIGAASAVPAWVLTSRDRAAA